MVKRCDWHLHQEDLQLLNKIFSPVQDKKIKKNNKLTEGQSSRYLCLSVCCKTTFTRSYLNFDCCHQYNVKNGVALDVSHWTKSINDNPDTYHQDYEHSSDGLLLCENNIGSYEE